MISKNNHASEKKLGRYMSKFDGWKKIKCFIILMLNDIVDTHTQHDLDK